MAEPKFGPAGNSESFAAAGFKKSEDAPAWLAQMGLTAFEYQCGRGVRCGEETALKIGAAAKQHGIQMSVHAPYFINLSSEESERMEKNVGYVLETARLAVPLGATRMVVHCGGQGKLTRDRAMRNSHENVKNILRALDEAHLTGCAVCLETMGKKSVLGTAEEVCELVAADDRLLPCIDFGHLNCRTGGHMNTREEVKALFDLMENTIGHERTAKLHAHFSHIEYNDKGEVRHLTFADTVYGPDFTPVAEETAARGYAPTFICESAGTQAEDALAEIQVTAQGHAAEKVTESLLIGRLHRVCDAGLERHAAQVLLVIPPWQLTGPVPGKAAGRLPPPHGLRLPPSGL